MLISLAIFLAFTLWTLFHWQELPELLKNESANERWPLSIHHTATPLRLIAITLLHSAFNIVVFYVVHKVVSTIWDSPLSPWLTLALLLTLNFVPYGSKLVAYVRYFFQRHVFFPALPSHQEDAIIKTLMDQAEHDANTISEINRLHDLLKRQFRGYLHAINLRSLKDERSLVRREFKQMRFRGMLEADQLTPIEVQQLRFHLYSCYRLLTRLILSKHWSGKERRRAFRNIDYTINIGDGSFYAQCRRLKHSFNRRVIHKMKR